jgi:hypothetical protein
MSSWGGSGLKKKPPRARKGGVRSEPPKTIGDLRKILVELGNPWRPDPALSDDEPIPKFPTGGDGNKEPPGQLLDRGGVIDFLKKTPPSNPFLRELWKRRGLIDESEKPERPRAKQRQRDGRG